MMSQDKNFKYFSELLLGYEILTNCFKKQLYQYPNILMEFTKKMHENESNKIARYKTTHTEFQDYVDNKYHNFFLQNFSSYCTSLQKEELCLYGCYDSGFSRLMEMNNAAKTIGKAVKIFLTKKVEEIETPYISGCAISKHKIKNFFEISSFGKKILCPQAEKEEMEDYCRRKVKVSGNKTIH